MNFDIYVFRTNILKVFLTFVYHDNQRFKKATVLHFHVTQRQADNTYKSSNVEQQPSFRDHI